MSLRAAGAFVCKVAKTWAKVMALILHNRNRLNKNRKRGILPLCSSRCQISTLVLTRFRWYIIQCERAVRKMNKGKRREERLANWIERCVLRCYVLWILCWELLSLDSLSTNTCSVYADIFGERKSLACSKRGREERQKTEEARQTIFKPPIVDQTSFDESNFQEFFHVWPLFFSSWREL